VFAGRCGESLRPVGTRRLLSRADQAQLFPGGRGSHQCWKEKGDVADEYAKTMSSSEAQDSAKETAAAINVLRETASASDSQVPRITESSTGVMINRARELVRKATGY
jgi:hypothetical protein